MSYDVVMVGGSGAQFGYALLECMGLGFVELPRAMYVVDADKGFFQKVLVPANGRFGEQVVEYMNHVSDGQTKDVSLPELKHVVPYGDAKPKFTVLDLLNATPLSRFGQVCLTADEAEYPIHEGLYGMAKLGGVIVADRAAKAAAGMVRGEQGAFPQALVKELGSQPQNVAPIIVAGSVAGGTGAGFMAPLLKAIRESQACAQRQVHVLTFLPWFDLPGAPSGIGPTNTRMALNASQGIRYLQDVLAEIEASAVRPACTCVHVIGLPDGASKPKFGSDGGGMHKADPGPMMYYAASLLSQDMQVFTGVTAVLESAVYSLSCNPATGGTGVLRGRVRYGVPAVGGGDDGMGPSQIPFEAVSQVLEVVVLALETLKDPNRFDSAFSRMLDNPDFLPRVVFNALKDGRSSTPDRVGAGIEMTKQFDDHIQRLKAQAEKLSVVNATVASASTALPDVEDWSRDRLKDVKHLDVVLRRSKNLQKLLKNAIAQNKTAIAADLVVRALVRGLALGEQGATAKLLLSTYSATPNTIVALPGQAPSNVEPVQGTPFVRLTPEVVDKLGETLTGSVLPDSQCVPSALARARVSRFLLEPRRIKDNHVFPMSLELAETPEGRLLLTWLGLSSGRWSVVDRQRLDIVNFPNLNNFDRAVAVFEPKDGPTPYRSSWNSLVASQPMGSQVADKDIVGASSPQTGWFTSVRVDEGSSKTIQVFRDLAQDLTANNLWQPLQATYRGWLDLVRREYPAVTGQVWFRTLNLFAGGPATEADREGFRRFVWTSVGPIALQVDGAVGQATQAKLVDMWLPRLIDPAERERIVCVMVGTASQVYEANPAVQIERRDGHVEYQVRSPQGNTVLLKVRAPQPQANLVSFAEDLLGGAYEIVEWSGAKGLPSWEAGFRPQFAARASAKFGAQVRNTSVTLAQVLAMYADRPDYAAAFGADNEKVAHLAKLAGLSAPFRPGIINLFNDEQRI